MTETIEPMTTGQVDQQRFAQELVEQARAQGIDLVGQGGLLTGLMKSVLETALEAEMTEHLGYDKHDVMGRNGGNSRNGTRTKTVLTEIGSGGHRGAPRPGRDLHAGHRAQAPAPPRRCR